MESQFVDQDFEEGMGLLVDKLTQCIQSKKYGWIVEKAGNFTVNFIFQGLKKIVRPVKRNDDGDLCDVPTKVRKLHVSLENLFLDAEQEETMLAELEAPIACSSDGVKNLSVRKRRIDDHGSIGSSDPKKSVNLKNNDMK